MLDVWDKYINVRVDVYKNGININDNPNASWIIPRESGGIDFENDVKPTPEAIGTLPNIVHYSTMIDKFKMSDFTPYFTVGEIGERFNVSTPSSFIKPPNEDLLSISDLQPITVVRTDKLTFPPDQLVTNNEWLYHIQIPLANEEIENDYVSLYVLCNFRGTLGASKAESASLFALSFINKSTIAINSPTGDLRSVIVKPTGLNTYVYNFNIFMIYSKGNDNNSSSIGVMTGCTYDNNDSKRLALIGAIANTNLSKLLDTITPNITP